MSDSDLHRINIVQIEGKMKSGDFIYLSQLGKEKLKDIPYFCDPENGYKMVLQYDREMRGAAGSFLYFKDLGVGYPKDYFIKAGDI